MIRGYHPADDQRHGPPIGFIAGLVGTDRADRVDRHCIDRRDTLAQLAARVDQVDFSSEPTMLPETRSAAPEIRALIAAFNPFAGSTYAQLSCTNGDARRTFLTMCERSRLACGLRVDHIPEKADRERAVADIDDMIRLLDDALARQSRGRRRIDRGAGGVQASRAGRGGRSLRASAIIHLQIGHEYRKTLSCSAIEWLRASRGESHRQRLAVGEQRMCSMDTSEQSVQLTVDDEGSGHSRRAAGSVARAVRPFGNIPQSPHRRCWSRARSVVRSLVEAHGGVINIGDAHRPGGARFTVSLPLFHA